MNLFFLQSIFYCLYVLYSFSTLLLLLCSMMHMRNADSVYVKVLDGVVLNKLLRVRVDTEGSFFEFCLKIS